MTAICDTSPAIGFARYDGCKLVLQVWTEVVIPTAVHREAVLADPHKPGAAVLANAISEGLIRVRRVARPDMVRQLDNLGAGEAEAIALAGEIPGSVVILEDAAGRSKAKALGLDQMGMLGVLALGKVRGLIPLTRPIVEALQGFGIYHGADVLSRHFQAVNE